MIRAVSFVLYATVSFFWPGAPTTDGGFVLKVICRGLRKACEVAVARLDAVSVKPTDDDQVSERLFGSLGS